LWAAIVSDGASDVSDRSAGLTVRPTVVLVGVSVCDRSLKLDARSRHRTQRTRANSICASATRRARSSFSGFELPLTSSRASASTFSKTVASSSTGTFNPWRSALRADLARPKRDFGPVLARELARLALLFRSLVKPPFSLRSELPRTPRHGLQCFVEAGYQASTIVGRSHAMPYCVGSQRSRSSSSPS
jgi:hypothetical protein